MRNTIPRKKKAVKSLPRETMMSKSDKTKSIDEMRQRRHRQDAYDCGYRDGVKRVRGSYYENQIAVARKRARDSGREVTRLNALVIKLAEKI